MNRTIPRSRACGGDAAPAPVRHRRRCAATIAVACGCFAAARAVAVDGEAHRRRWRNPPAHVPQAIAPAGRRASAENCRKSIERRGSAPPQQFCSQVMAIVSHQNYGSVRGKVSKRFGLSFGHDAGTTQSALFELSSTWRMVAPEAESPARLRFGCNRRGVAGQGRPAPDNFQ